MDTEPEDAEDIKETTEEAREVREEREIKEKEKEKEGTDNTEDNKEKGDVGDVENRMKETEPEKRRIDQELPEILILGPGGAKMIMGLGFLFPLEKNKIFSEVKTFVGVSAGALVALLMVCGYTITEIITFACEVNIFEDIRKFNLANVRDNMGVVSPDIVREKLSNLIVNKIGYIPTLQELFMFSNKEFVSIAYNLNTCKVEQFSYLTQPTASCVEAVLLSINIPGLFCKITYGGHFYVDGALGNPYPVNLYDDGKKIILGIYIDGRRPQEGDLGHINYFHRSIQAPMDQLRDFIINKSSEKCYHVCLKTDILDTTGVSLCSEDKSNMLIYGIKEANKFVDRYFPSKKKKKVKFQS